MILWNLISVRERYSRLIFQRIDWRACNPGCYEEEGATGWLLVGLSSQSYCLIKGYQALREHCSKPSGVHFFFFLSKDGAYIDRTIFERLERGQYPLQLPVLWVVLKVLHQDGI